MVQNCKKELAVRKRQNNEWRYLDLKDSNYWWTKTSSWFKDCFSKDKKLVQRKFEEQIEEFKVLAEVTVNVRKKIFK